MWCLRPIPTWTNRVRPRAWSAESTGTTQGILAADRCYIFFGFQSPHVSSSSRRFLATDNHFVVSILGPPNAGKSTLFNRLQCKEKNRSYRLGSSKRKVKGRIASKHESRGDAIVSRIAGTTRDRRECWGRIGGTEFLLMDTAGVDGDRIQLLNKKAKMSNNINDDNNNKYPMERAMMQQTLEAAKQSDLVLLLWDAKLGLTHDLTETARWLRKLGKDSNIALLANKLEGDAWAYPGSPVMNHIDEVSRLGLGEVIPISALQGDGLADIAVLIEQLKAQKAAAAATDNAILYSQQEQEQSDDDTIPTEHDNKPTIENTAKTVHMAVLGRQNVGKSTLVNRLLQSERVLTGPTPGLTRDAIAIQWTWNDIPIQLVDTAGIRKLTKRVNDSIEDMAVADALRAMKLAEVVVLVLDAEELYLHRQEIAICNAILEEGRALVIAANKMDLLEMTSQYTPTDYANNVRKQLEERMPILRQTPIIPMSSLSGAGVERLLPAVIDAKDRWSKTYSTSVLNRWLKEVANGTRPPVVKGITAKLKYVIQTKGRPPTFIIFSNVDELPDSYVRYLTRNFQDTFKLYAMGVRIVIKKSAETNPYQKKKRGGSGLGGREARFKRRIKEVIAKKRKLQKSN